VPLSSRDVQGESSSTPLFCIHPGSGDILVFIALAAHFPTRPVYAVRTRGFNPGERLFSSIAETAETYAAQIRETQPRGPYAIAGYSLGSTLAYEVSKILEGQGQEVRFLASIDYPPHIAQYVHHLTWADVLLHIAFFLELIDQDTMDASTQHVRSLCRDDALSYILTIGNDERITALALDKDKLELICDIAENFRVNAQSYEPIGLVNTIDVFVADPPHYAARDRQDWRENKLGPWANFARSNAAFHECPGIHAKMLNKEHVADFARIFKAAMRRRGV
jgi:thioesterase domain-containing protein